MIKTMHRTTTQISSSFGMPACGHACGPISASVITERPWVKSAQSQATFRAVDVDFDTTAARGGKGLGFTGDLGATPAYLPGIFAWSPPSC